MYDTRMKAALRLAALAPLLAAPRAFATPDMIDLERLAGGAQAAGFAASPARLEAPPPPTPRSIPELKAVPDDRRVDLRGLLDRHWETTDSFSDAAGRTLVAGTLDLSGDGWLVVTPPGRGPLLVKIERGMSAEWEAGGRRYSADLDVSIFRARLNNLIEIKGGDGSTLWKKRIVDLFQRTYQAGGEVVIAGRVYRLFLSRMPDGGRPASPSDRVGLCLIYDELDESGRHSQYDFYRFPIETMEGSALAAKLFGGDAVLLQASPDGSELTISR